MLKFTLILIFLQVIGSLSTTFDPQEEFEKFIARYGKTYRPGTSEYNKRFKIFKGNYVRAYMRNVSYPSHDGSAVYGVTKFSDLEDHEFRQHLNLIHDHELTVDEEGSPLLFQPRYGDVREPDAPQNLPKRVDWRNKNVIGPVVDQYFCGACWAISDVQLTESMYAIKTGTVKRFSVQQFIDCATEGNFACVGGDICRALKWYKKHNITLVEDSVYPLTLFNKTCRTFPPETFGVRLKNFTCQSFNGYENEMLALLANHGPIVTTVDASTWVDYVGGIVMYHCGKKRNHAVQIVGYDISGPVPFYIIKNSWGINFGHDGYIYVKMGENMCGISDRVATVTI